MYIAFGEVAEKENTQSDAWEQEREQTATSLLWNVVLILRNTITNNTFSIILNLSGTEQWYVLKCYLWHNWTFFFFHIITECKSSV